MRVTERMLREDVERIQGYFEDISIEWAYGRPAIYNAKGGIKLSPRLPTGRMNNWLHGFETGFAAGYKQAMSVARTAESVKNAEDIG